MSGPVRVEASGETVGEARWAALRELERRYPSLDRAKVEFVVASEGERGVLGVGYRPAQVVAMLSDPPPAASPAPAAPADAPPIEDRSPAGAVRELVAKVVDACGLHARVEVSDDGARILAQIDGDDLGLLIGRHGQTIDALQYLANVIVRRTGEGGGDREVVIDAHGYRQRRERALAELAARTVDEVLNTGRAVALEPMTPVERKIVHLAIEPVAGVATTSEGVEPNRRVVVLPEPPSDRV